MLQIRQIIRQLETVGAKHLRTIAVLVNDLH